MRTRDTKTGQYVSPNGNGRAAKQRLDAIVQNALSSALTSRYELMRRFMDPRRDIDDECGYPKTEQITTSEHYKPLYEREPLAARVVELMPMESWQATPTVYEVEDVDRFTPFEQAWSDLPKSLRGESWHQDEEGSIVWDYLRRVDVLSGIGHYGLLLLGLDDGRELIEPTERGAGRKLLYLRTFDETLAQITSYETDVKSPRYGQPVEYSLSFHAMDESTSASVGLASASRKVHWSRVIHVADNLGSNEVFGVPRLQAVYNRVYDLCKLYGGSAEMYWRGAFPGLSIETHPQLGGDVVVDNDTLRTAMEKYMTGLQRYLSLVGMSAKSLAPQVVDPTPQIDAQITAICIRLGMPKRILMGSERGQLASSQDDHTWNDRLRDRQNMYLTPRLIVPFIDRLIALGVLPPPAEGYSVTWPDLEALSEEQQANIAAKRTEAMAKYVQAGVDTLLPPLDFLTRVVRFSDAEAQEIIRGVLEQSESDIVEEEHDNGGAVEEHPQALA